MALLSNGTSSALVFLQMYIIYLTAPPTSEAHPILWSFPNSKRDQDPEAALAPRFLSLALLPQDEVGDG